MVESQGKVSEKSVNFEMDIKWQPWKTCVLLLTGKGAHAQLQRLAGILTASLAISLFRK